ncbi:MAG: efflux RND transporter periplasmic adaptor subunit [Labilithrix sp.]|nr:efflux RND transporter periplasmic adaptor subunit [Labilithrix sp.]
MKSLFAASIMVAVPVLGLGVAACSNKSEAASKSRPAPLVVVAKVASKDVAAEVRAPVELRPLAQAEVGSKTLGYLDAVLVERGDKVKRGQLVALVRPSDLPDQLVAARGSLSQAQASATLARNNLERVNGLAPRGVVSQQELQQAQAALATAEAQEAAAKAQVAAYATRLGETQITSPLDGVVAVRRLDPGALVGPTAGQTILTVAQTNVLRVFVTVTEREAHRVKLGQRAHVEVDALAGHRVEGAVVRLAPMLDPATRTLDAEVQIDNASGDLRPGMFGRGSIVVDVHPNAAVVPATALQITNGKRFVFVLAGDKVQRREVETGVDEGTWLEVTKGVAAGEEVVTVGMDAISDGAVVRVSRDVDPFKGRVDASAGDAGASRVGGDGTR